MTLKVIALSGLIVMGAALKAYAADRTYDVSGFDKIEVASGVEVEVNVGGAFAVEAEVLRGDIDRLEVTVKGDTLNIGRAHGWRFLGSGPQDRFHVTIRMPALDQAQSTSGATVLISEATEGLAYAQSTSGATLKIDGSLGDLKLDASSGATLQVSGTCRQLDAHSSSGAQILAEGLNCASARLHSSSGSALRAHVAVAVDVHASSGGFVQVRGDATVMDRQRSSGGMIVVN